MRSQDNIYPLVHGMAKRYQFRWRFAYFDGKPDRLGLWDRLGKKETMACYAPKENLAWVIVEAKDIKTNKVTNHGMVKGQDFVNFEWFVATCMQGLRNDQLTYPQVLGVKLITRTDEHTMYINGARKVMRRPDVSSDDFFNWRK